MSTGDIDRGTVGEAGFESGSRGRSGGDSGLASRVTRYVRRGVGSGALPGLAGAAVAFGGLRALRRGARARGLARVVLGGLLVALAVRRRRTAGESDADRRVDGPAQVGSGPAESDRSRSESTASEGRTASPGSRADAAAAGTEARSETRARETYERLGEAAFDEHASRVPAPQPAFDREFLALDAEAFWGVSEDDGTVFLSQAYDPIEERSGVRYVASSEVDDEREVRVPDRVLDHWDDLAEGGVAVESGDDVVFATTDDLRTEYLLVVVPEAWIDEFRWDEE